MEEITMAPSRAHEARIGITFCHSDITFWKMKEFAGISPRILGTKRLGKERPSSFPICLCNPWRFQCCK
ncbi:hypothetical protein LINPERPRIM_LOCUS29163 [Linum perenne]